MLSFSFDELEAYTQPLCAPGLYAVKHDNYRAVEKSYVAREECCAGRPVHLHLEATTDCNLRCALCPTGRGLVAPRGSLSFETFSAAFGSLGETLANIAICGWGEPLLNPDTTKMIGLATNSGVPVFLNTNGTLLHDLADDVIESRPTIITVALDGAVSKSTHTYNEEYSFDTVVKGVVRLRTLKDKHQSAYPMIHGKIIVTEQTVGEIEELTRWAFGIGIEHVKFKRKYATMPGQVDRGRFPSLAALQRVNAHGGVRSTEDLDFTPSGCSHPWDSLFLGADGRFGRCSWDPHQTVKLTAAAAGFDALWNGPHMCHMRRSHAGRAPVGEPCSKCNRLPGYLRKDTATGPPN